MKKKWILNHFPFLLFDIQNETFVLWNSKGIRKNIFYLLPSLRTSSPLSDGFRKKNNFSCSKIKGIREMFDVCHSFEEENCCEKIFLFKKYWSRFCEWWEIDSNFSCSREISLEVCVASKTSNNRKHNKRMLFLRPIFIVQRSIRNSNASNKAPECLNRKGNSQRKTINF